MILATWLSRGYRKDTGGLPRRSFLNANPPRLEFTLISRNDGLETTFELK